jgi:heme-degrading monooxygenase HmoA
MGSGCTFPAMIARIWRGTVAADRASEYLEVLHKTGLSEYAATPGCRGIQVLTRTTGDRTLFTIITQWDSLDAVKAFAGDDPEVAVYYPEDDEYLLDRAHTVEHHEIVHQE